MKEGLNSSSGYFGKTRSTLTQRYNLLYDVSHSSNSSPVPDALNHSSLQFICCGEHQSDIPFQQQSLGQLFRRRPSSAHGTGDEETHSRPLRDLMQMGFYNPN